MKYSPWWFLFSLFPNFSNSYLVKIFGLKASEISLMRGGLQTLIFTLIVAVNAVNEPKDGNIRTKDPVCSVIKSFCQVCVYGLLVAVSSFSVMSALPLMPIGDLVVICFTQPIFSVIFECIILNRKLTLLSVVLCIFIGLYLPFTESKHWTL